jgi:ABC-2 type transport system permease protein
MGELMGLPKWFLNMSPMAHVPKVLLAEMDYIPLIAMTAVAAVLTAAGFFFYSRRDMEAS